MRDRVHAASTGRRARGSGISACGLRRYVTSFPYCGGLEGINKLVSLMNSCRGYEESGRDVQIPSDGHAVDDWGFAAFWHAASAAGRDDRFQQRKRVHGVRDDRESESRRSSGRHRSGRRRGRAARRLSRFDGRLRHWRAIRQSEFPLVDGKSGGCMQEAWKSLLVLLALLRVSRLGTGWSIRLGRGLCWRRWMWL